MSLKKELGNAAKESSKLYQESERNRHQLDKLRIDNKSMEMEIDKFRNERRVYYNKLNEIDSLKKEIGQELAEKNSLIEESNSKMKKLERSAGDMRVRM